MKKFLIHCCVGSCGMFLTSLIAKVLKYDVEPVISDRGHCHQLNENGIWHNTHDVNFIGEFWNNFCSDKKLFYTHVLDIPRFRKDHPDIKLIVIDFDISDAPLISKLFVCKAWPDIWTLEEYNKWAGPSWPDYSANNISESSMIRNEIVADLVQTRILPWLKDINVDDYDHKIDFKTIMGLNSTKLDSVIYNILDQPLDNDSVQYIQRYQQINRDLYIND